MEDTNIAKTMLQVCFVKNSHILFSLGADNLTFEEGWVEYLVSARVFFSTDKQGRYFSPSKFINIHLLLTIPIQN